MNQSQYLAIFWNENGTNTERLLKKFSILNEESTTAAETLLR
jgi:hypothetical protein